MSPAGNPFRVVPCVLVCVRAVWLPSGIGSQKRMSTLSLFPFFCLFELSLFPFRLGELSLLPDVNDVTTKCIKCMKCISVESV